MDDPSTPEARGDFVPSPPGSGRRGFLWAGALATAGALLARWPYAGAQGTQTVNLELVSDTLRGLLAFIVPGPDRHSQVQAATSPTPGGVDLGVVELLIETIDQTAPYLPAFSGVVANVLNGLALTVSPDAGAGPLPAPFSNLSFAQKAVVFKLMDATPELKALGGVLPPFVAFFCYSEAAAFDPDTRRLRGQPVAWALSDYRGVADGRNEFRGYVGAGRGEKGDNHA